MSILSRAVVPIATGALLTALAMAAHPEGSDGIKADISEGNNPFAEMSLKELGDTVVANGEAAFEAAQGLLAEAPEPSQ